MNPVPVHIKSGHFRRALDALPGSQRFYGRFEFDALRAELEFATGNSTVSLRTARHLSDPATAGDSIALRMQLILAMISQRRLRYIDAFNHYAKAVELSIHVEDVGVTALCQLARLSFVLDADPTDYKVTLFAEARRAVARSADPRMHVEMRLLLGKVEAQRRSLDEARRHLLEAGELLASFPNVWLSARQQLGLCVIETLAGDLEDAAERARLAISLAAESSHIRTQRAGLINLSHVLHARGDLPGARVALKAVLQESTDDDEIRLAALDALANVELSGRGEQETATTIGEIDSIVARLPPDFRPRWSVLTLCETSARFYLQSRRFEECRRAVNRMMELSSFDSVWNLRRHLLQLEMHASTGDWNRVLTAIRGLSGVDLPPEARARFWLALNQSPIDAVRRRSGLEAARQHCAAAGGSRFVDACTEAIQQIPKAEQSSSASVVDVVAGLFSVAGNPALLAESLKQLLHAAGSDGEIVQMTHELVADERRGDGSASGPVLARSLRREIECGEQDGQRWVVRSIGAMCLETELTWLASDRLVAAARALHRSREEEKRRGAIWPLETIEVEGEAVWKSETIRQVLADAGRAAKSQATILLTGETGTGKEMMARAIHQASKRADKSFIPINCSATPRDLLESQLFGFKKGSFTGADVSFSGVIRTAEAGTLFLDEIGDLPIDLQPKLLRFLESHEIHPIGDAKPTKLDVRVIAATNVNLPALIAAGQFREDLYYRLSVLPLHLPPLRERREEIPPLATHFLKRFAAEEGKGNLVLSDEAVDCLLLYRWPGNVRQLANEINRVVAMADANTVITAAQLSADIRLARPSPPPPAALSGDRSQQTFVLQPGERLPDAVERLERMLVERALRQADGRVEEAARILGISRKGLFLKRRRWGLDNGPEPEES